MFLGNDPGHILKELERKRDDIETVFLIGLEGSRSHDPSWSILRTVLDSLVRNSQPSPVLTHVELLILPRTWGDEVHFSTYLGHHAGWGSTFPNSREFYLGAVNGHNWRAIPVQGVKIAEMLRRVCTMTNYVPYSLTRYAFSVPPLRAFAGLLPDSPSSPAHCAGLSARLLMEACNDLSLPNPPPWYSPSTIYIELARPRRMKEISQHASKLSVADNEVKGAVETLLRGSDVAVQAMQPQMSLRGILHITECVAAQRSTRLHDAVRERILEKRLARALLRYVELAV